MQIEDELKDLKERKNELDFNMEKIDQIEVSLDCNIIKILNHVKVEINNY